MSLFFEILGFALFVFWLLLIARVKEEIGGSRQIAGLNTGYDHIVTRGPEGDAVSFWYFKGDQLLAVDAMNDPRAYMVGKRLIEQGRSPDPAALRDPATNMKALLK